MGLRLLEEENKTEPLNSCQSGTTDPTGGATRRSVCGLSQCVFPHTLLETKGANENHEGFFGLFS